MVSVVFPLLTMSFLIEHMQLTHLFPGVSVLSKSHFQLLCNNHFPLSNYSDTEVDHGHETSIMMNFSCL